MVLIVRRQVSLSLGGFLILESSLFIVLCVGPWLMLVKFISLISCLVLAEGIIPVSKSSDAISNMHSLEEREK